MPPRSVENAPSLDWSAASRDYLKYRNGYPQSYFTLLKDLGIGLRGQKILDLGTGTGALAIPFASQGAQVTALDPAPGQVEAARERAKGSNLSIRFIVSGAEDSGLPDFAYDVVTASMCWGYFDLSRAVPEIHRLLAPGGSLLIGSILWASEPGSVSARTDGLISRYNPRFVHGHGGEKGIEAHPTWAEGRFRLRTFHRYVEPVNFTKETWRGRIRATKWIGADLAPEKVQAFDVDHQELLKDEPEPLRLPHRISLQIFEKI